MARLTNDSDAHANGKVRSSVADLSRPRRAITLKFTDKHKKPQGRKAAALPVQQAKYHNWFTPFAWSQIEIAVRQVGWKMGASEIVAAAKRIDPVVFGGLRCTTVKSWIDLSGDKPKWTTAVLRRIDRGNDTGHNKGGQRGVW